jgi:glycosyltransferase involved in cell wall biosynthesis
MTNKVSVIIATYNRHDYLLNAIKSIKTQTHKNIEIIVVNDGSTQLEYSENLGDDVIQINLPQNTRSIFGFPCPGYSRTQGMKVATGEYIAFLDDDDVWLPNKLSLQLDAMKKTGCQMSTSDAYADYEIYNPTNQYKCFYSQIDFAELQHIHRRQGSNMLDNGFPEIWNKKFVELHNCCMTSSVILHKSIVEKVGYMQNVRIGQEDWSYWKKVLDHTDSVFVREPCVYYTRRNY